MDEFSKHASRVTYTTKELVAQVHTRLDSIEDRLGTLSIQVASITAGQDSGKWKWALVPGFAGLALGIIRLGTG